MSSFCLQASASDSCVRVNSAEDSNDNCTFEVKQSLEKGVFCSEGNDECTTPDDCSYCTFPMSSFKIAINDTSSTAVKCLTNLTNSAITTTPRVSIPPTITTTTPQVLPTITTSTPLVNVTTTTSTPQVDVLPTIIIASTIVVAVIIIALMIGIVFLAGLVFKYKIRAKNYRPNDPPFQERYIINERHSELTGRNQDQLYDTIDETIDKATSPGWQADDLRSQPWPKTSTKKSSQSDVIINGEANKEFKASNLDVQNTVHFENNGLPLTETVSPYEEPVRTLKNYHKSANTSSKEMAALARTTPLPATATSHDYAVVENLTKSATAGDCNMTSNGAYLSLPGNDYTVLEQPTSASPPTSTSEKTLALNSFPGNESVPKNPNSSETSEPLNPSQPRLQQSGEETILSTTLNSTESHSPGPDYAVLEQSSPDYAVLEPSSSENLR